MNSLLLIDRRRLTKRRVGYAIVQPDQSGHFSPERADYGLNTRSASAITLGNGLFLTAGHLIRYWPVQGGFVAPDLAALVDTGLGKASAIPETAIHFPSRYLSGEYDYRRVDTTDWALLSARESVEDKAVRAALPKILADLPGTEEKLTLSGHPGGQWRVETQQVCLVADPAPNERFFWTSGYATNGSSGSSLTDGAGRLLGVLSGTNRDSNGEERVRFQRMEPVVEALRNLT